jgi:phosphatidylinositol glycan class C protein
MVTGEWERVLWREQPFPDNYVPESFLSSLAKNPNFKPYTYWTLVFLSCPIAHHVGTTFIFLATFVRIKERLLDPRILVWISVVAFLVGYAIWEVIDYYLSKVLNRPRQLTNHAKTLKSSILVFLALLSLSPVLKTLTAASSSDSIWAFSACLFILNALLADYSAVKLGAYSRERLTSVISMNAAVSASVVLASRLPDDISVFSVMLFSVVLFALFPVLRHRLQAAPGFLQPLLTVLISLTALLLTVSLSVIVTALFATVLSFVTFVAPAVFVWAQRYKNELRGSWDVAVPKVNQQTWSK